MNTASYGRLDRRSRNVAVYDSEARLNRPDQGGSHRQDGVRVNALAPVLVEMPMMKQGSMIRNLRCDARRFAVRARSATSRLGRPSPSMQGRRLGERSGSQLIQPDERDRPPTPV